jgi:hypothetical protein
VGICTGVAPRTTALELGYRRSTASRTSDGVAP